MKINAIQYTQKINSLTNKRFFNNSVQNDIFVREEAVSFGKKKSRVEMAKDFAKDVKKYYFDEPFSLKGVEKVAQKGVKDIVVKDYRELDDTKDTLKTFMGALLSGFSYDETKDQVKSSLLEIYLKNPDENTDIDRVAYYANSVHEYTHALQQVDKEVSDTAVLNRLLRKSNASSEVKDRTITHIGKFVLDAERRIKQPLRDVETDLDKQYYYTFNPTTITKLYENEGIKDIKKYAVNEIKNLIPEYIDVYGEMDSKILFEYTLNHLQKESEAYQADYDAHKRMHSKYVNNPIFWNVGAVVQLYKILASIKV